MSIETKTLLLIVLCLCSCKSVRLGTTYNTYNQESEKHGAWIEVDTLADNEQRVTYLKYKNGVKHGRFFTYRKYDGLNPHLKLYRKGKYWNGETHGRSIIYFPGSGRLKKRADYLYWHGHLILRFKTTNTH